MRDRFLVQGMKGAFDTYYIHLPETNKNIVHAKFIFSDLEQNLFGHSDLSFMEMLDNAGGDVAFNTDENNNTSETVTDESFDTRDTTATIMATQLEVDNLPLVYKMLELLV